MVILESSRLFRDMAPEEWKSFRETVQMRSVADGVAVFQEGDPGDGIYVVRNGRVEISAVVQGERRALSHFGPGDFFGEMSVLDNEPRSASVVAVSDVVTASLAQSALLEFVRGSPEFALAMMRSLTTMIRGTNARIRDMTGLSARQRVAVEIDRLARSLRTGGSERVTLIPAPTASEIAHRAGTTRETVARTVSCSAAPGKP